MNIFKTHTVSYYDNGTCLTALTQLKNYYANLTLGNGDTLTKSGCFFVGWNKQEDGNGTNYAKGASYTTHAPLILYAKWTKAPDAFAGTATISNMEPRIGDVLNGYLDGGNNSGTLTHVWKLMGQGCIDKNRPNT